MLSMDDGPSFNELEKMEEALGPHYCGRCHERTILECADYWLRYRCIFCGQWETIEPCLPQILGSTKVSPEAIKETVPHSIEDELLDEISYNQLFND